MSRKWIALPLSAVAVALLGAGLSQDEKKTKVGENMEKIQKHYISVTKAVRTKVAYKKAGDGKGVAKDAEEIIKLGKEVREEKGPAAKAKLPVEKYTKYMDEMIKASEDLAKLTTGGGSQAEAKKAFQTVQKSCAACHKDFRPEDDDF